MLLEQLKIGWVAPSTLYEKNVLHHVMTAIQADTRLPNLADTQSLPVRDWFHNGEAAPAWVELKRVGY